MTHDRTFQMRVDAAWLVLIDTWRRGQTEIPSRSEAVRRLTLEGLKVVEGGRIIAGHPQYAIADIGTLMINRSNEAAAKRKRKAKR